MAAASSTRSNARVHVLRLGALASLSGAFAVGCGDEPRLQNEDTESSQETRSQDTSRGPASQVTSSPGESSPGSAASGSTAIGETPIDCEVPTFDESPEPEPFERLTATVVDDTGAPVEGLLVQACGLDVCLNGKTNAAGDATIASEESIAKLGFKYGDGLHFAQVVLLLGGETDYDLGEQVTVALPKGDPTARFEPGSVLTSSDVNLELDGDAEVTIDELSYADPSEHLFVARAFPDAAFPGAAAGREFVSVWALGPAKTEFCPPAKLSLPNLTDLAPEAEVDLELLVTDVSGRFGRYAEWTTIASGTVSADGSVIVTNDGAGIPELGLIGVRPRK